MNDTWIMRLFVAILVATLLSITEGIPAESDSETVARLIDGLCDIERSRESEASLRAWQDRDILIEAAAEALSTDRFQNAQCRYLLLAVLVADGPRDVNGVINLNSPLLVDVLRNALSDSNHRIRLTAAQSLGLVAPELRPSVLSDLLATLDDSEPKVISACAVSIWRIGYKDDQLAELMLARLRATESAEGSPALAYQLGVAYSRLAGGIGELPTVSIPNDPASSVEMALARIVSESALLTGSTIDQVRAAADRLSNLAIIHNAPVDSRVAALEATKAIFDHSSTDPVLLDIIGQTFASIAAEPISEASAPVKAAALQLNAVAQSGQ